ncbi:MAG: recombinase family protein [Pseudomonadota bacterium]
MKVVGYCRTSTMDNSQERIESQEEDIINQSKLDRNELVKVFKDAGKSGGNMVKRTEFIVMLDYVKENDIKLIYCRDLDRFARNFIECINTIDELKDKGIGVYFIKQRTNTMGGDLTSDLVLGIFAIIAQWERAVIKQRTQGRRDALRKEKKIFVGRSPLGYVWNKVEKQFDIEPEGARLYKRMVSLYIDEGLAFLDVAAVINKELKQGLYDIRNKSYSDVGVRNAVKNPLYLGYYKGDKENKEDYVLSYEMTPLITQERYDMILERVRTNTISAKNTQRIQSYFCRDIMRCGVCGAKVRANELKKKGEYKRYYCCYYKHASKKKLEADGKKRCELSFLPADDVESYVWMKLTSRMLLNPDKLISESDISDQITQQEAKIKALKSTLKKKETTKENLYELLESQEFNQTSFIEKFNQIEGEIIALKNQIQDNDQRLLQFKESATKEKALLDYQRKNGKKQIRQMLDELGALSEADKKTFVEANLSGPCVVQFEGGKEKRWSIDVPFSFNATLFQKWQESGKLTASFTNSFPT